MEGAWYYGTRVLDKGMHKARAKGMGQGWDYGMEQGKGYVTMDKVQGLV